MIKIQLGELRNIAEGLNEILTKELPIKPAYWFGKLGKKVHKELAEFEENRVKLIKKYASKDDKGEFIVKDNKYEFEDKEAFNSEFIELAGTEIEIDFNPISIEQLGDAKITPVIMMALEKFMEETPC